MNIYCFYCKEERKRSIIFSLKRNRASVLVPWDLSQESFLILLFNVDYSFCKACHISVFFLLMFKKSNLAGGLKKDLKMDFSYVKSDTVLEQNHDCVVSNCCQLQEGETSPLSEMKISTIVKPVSITD